MMYRMKMTTPWARHSRAKNTWSPGTSWFTERSPTTQMMPHNARITILLNIPILGHKIIIGWQSWDTKL